MVYEYPIKYRKDDNGTYLVTCPDFPEVKTYGETLAKCKVNAADAIEEAICGRIANREGIPLPSKGRNRAALPMRVSVKLALHSAMSRKNLTKASLARKMNLHRPQIDRLLDVRHNSNLNMIERALEAVGARVRIEAEGA